MRTTIAAIVAVIVIALGYWWWTGFFGDTNAPRTAGESADMAANEQAEGNAKDQTQRIETTRAALVGKWQSTEDSNFIRTFSSAGRVVDTYAQGDETTAEVGSWSVFVDPAAEVAEIPVIDGAVYLKVAFDGEPLYFTVPDVNTESLTLIYLNRGGALLFEKVQ